MKTLSYVFGSYKFPLYTLNDYSFVKYTELCAVLWGEPEAPQHILDLGLPRIAYDEDEWTIPKDDVRYWVAVKEKQTPVTLPLNWPETVNYFNGVVIMNGLTHQNKQFKSNASRYIELNFSRDAIARTVIPKETVIGFYAGVLLCYPTYCFNPYLYKIEQDIWIDGYGVANETRFIQDYRLGPPKCQPNVRIAYTKNDNYATFGFIATRDIGKGEQIFANYGGYHDLKMHAKYEKGDQVEVYFEQNKPTKGVFLYSTTSQKCVVSVQDKKYSVNIGSICHWRGPFGAWCKLGEDVDIIDPLSGITSSAVVIQRNETDRTILVAQYNDTEHKMLKKTVDMDVVCKKRRIEIEEEKV